MRARPWMGLAAGAGILATLTGCANPKCRERGWIGGDLRPVQACGSWYEAPPPALSGGGVIGMPADAGATCGLLVHDLPCASPLARAGVKRGDLIVALDGKPVGTPLQFREAVEAHPPGTTAALDVWRGGGKVALPAVVGRERYERQGTISLRIPIDPHVDLNPFDDGINVFGFVVAQSHTQRHDLASVERGYLAEAVPCRAAPCPIQEKTEVGVFPLYVGAQTRVLAQETVAPTP